MAIYNYRELPSGKLIELAPTGKQKRFLLDRWADRVFGSNFNWYGYQDKNRVYKLTPTELKKYKALAPQEPKKPKKEVDTFGAWCRRLSKLTGITIEEAETIAQEKLDYQSEKIQEMLDRDMESPSIQRSKLIDKMARENPLRRIQDDSRSMDW